MPKQRKDIGTQFLETLNNAVSREDVTALFKELVNFVKGVKTSLEGMHAKHEQMMKGEVEKLSKSQMEANNAMSKAHQDMEATMRSEMRTTMRYIDDKVNEVRGEMPEMPDMKPMHNELSMRIAEVEAKIPVLPEIPPQFDPTEMVQKIDEHEKEIEELKKRPIGTVGGGRITDVALEHAMGRAVKQETPAGTFNGSNTDFTVNSTIHAVLSFELNSRVVSLGEYSIIGGYRKTVRFDSAPSAAYAGKSFVITYI